MNYVASWTSTTKNLLKAIFHEVINTVKRRCKHFWKQSMFCKKFSCSNLNSFSFFPLPGNQFNSMYMYTLVHIHLPSSMYFVSFNKKLN